MKNKKTCLLISCLGLLFAVVSISCVIGIIYLAQEYESDSEKETQQEEMEYLDDYDSPDMTGVNIDIESIQVESINNDNIKSPEPENLKISEVELALDTVKLLQAANWDGDKDAPLPISIDDYDQSKLDGYIAKEAKRGDNLTIPADIEDLYTPNSSNSEILSLMMLAREEYLSYLEAKGVNSKYIDEIKDNALPASTTRIEYVGVNDPYAEPTSAGGYVVDSNGEKDYSQVSVILYAVDVYNVSTIIYDSKILGDYPTDQVKLNQYWEDCRNMAVRQLMYHEMTHVLQRAYVNVTVDPSHKTDKSAYVYADKTMVDIDDQYFWEWGNTVAFQGSNNRQISQESQSDGISFEILTNVYDMSAVQKEALWKHLFGRLTGARTSMNQIKSIVESEWPDLSFDGTADAIELVMKDYSNSADRKTLINLAGRVAGFPAYIGYFNPMEPEDTHLFWDFLKN